MWIRIVYPPNLYRPPINLVTDENEAVHCPGYESRSGATYTHCYEYRDGKWREITGLVPVAEKILTWISDGVWHAATGRATPKEHARLGALLRIISDMGIPVEYYKYLLLVEDAWNSEIYIRKARPSITLYAAPYKQQGHLEIYRLLNKNGKEQDIWFIEEEERDWFDIEEQWSIHNPRDIYRIYNHYIITSKLCSCSLNGFVIVAERSTRYGEGVLLAVGEGVIVFSEDHPEPVRLSRGVYWLWHPCPRSGDVD